ncbi:MAG: hypothetical protein JWO59_449, partial [Chloroflexi bacterium]|nr:hypothetical protein [Chloroflexota bacterium]
DGSESSSQSTTVTDLPPAAGRTGLPACCHRIGRTLRPSGYPRTLTYGSSRRPHFHMSSMISGNRLADVANHCLLRAMTPTETEESRALAWDTAIHGLSKIDAPPHGRPRLGRPARSGHARDTPRTVARRPRLSEGGDNGSCILGPFDTRTVQTARNGRLSVSNWHRVST